MLLTARNEDGSRLTDTEIGDELSTFMLAGHETSAVTLSWALALLSAYPPARDRLEDEVDSVLTGREPETADAERLPWTTAVIAETLRLYPPAWTVERDALGDDSVAGVPVPAGSTVAVPPYLVHRHPDFWPDPAGFDPARFLPATDAAASPAAAGTSRTRLAATVRVTPIFRSAAAGAPASGSRSPNSRPCWCWPRSRSGSGWS